MGLVRYPGTGKSQRKIVVEYSMNEGRSWQRKDLMAGQSFPVPPNCTNLVLDNVPYDASASYEIRDGKVVRK